MEDQLKIDIEDVRKNYYTIIPTSIIFDKEIDANEKILYGIITSICNEKGYCHVSDATLGEIIGVSERTIQNYLKKLKKHNLIRIQKRKMFNKHSVRTITII